MWKALTPTTILACALLSIGACSSEPAGLATVVIQTDLGEVVVEVDTSSAPVTGLNFLRYVEGGFYEGGSFYRVVRMDNQPNDSLRIEVIQAGINPDRREDTFDPIALEGTQATGLRHLDGTLSMARGGPDTARSSFFICIGDQPELDEGGLRNPDGRGFAAFGRVVAGMDVVRAIQQGETEGQNLVDPVAIRSAGRR
jgi:peptidyl-prolyl cis-trans isomerase A (cyclophilin A)